MKYKLIKEPNSKYFRIKALKDIPRYNVKKGDLGGLVETEGNLDQTGDSWIDKESKVLNNAYLWGNAYVCNGGVMRDNSGMGGAAKLDGGYMQNYSRAKGYAIILGTMHDSSMAFGTSYLGEYVRLEGLSTLSDNAFIKKRSDVVTFSNIGSEGSTLTVYQTKGEPWVNRGCFTGTVEEFLACSYEKHDDTINLEYVMLIEVALSILMRSKANT